MSEWQRTETTPGIFLMTKYITDYEAAGLDYTEHLWTAIPETGSDYKYTYFTWAPSATEATPRDRRSCSSTAATTPPSTSPKPQIGYAWLSRRTWS